MNISYRFGVIILIIIAGLNARNEDPIYYSIESFLSKYRQKINYDDVSLQNGIIRLEIRSRRTNIKSQLLLGFHSVGRALQNSSTLFREVHVVIYYDLKEKQEVLASAPAEKVLDLSQGRLSAKQFFTIIRY